MWKAKFTARLALQTYLLVLPARQKIKALASTTLGILLGELVVPYVLHKAAMKRLHPALDPIPRLRLSCLCDGDGQGKL